MTSAKRPPTSNRGAEIRPQMVEEVSEASLTVHVDYVQVTFPRTGRFVVADLLGPWLPGEWMPAERGWLGYEMQLVGFGGARVLSSSRRPEVHVVIPGKACSALANEDMASLLGCVRERGGKVTRIDLAGDDFERVAEPVALREAVARGELVTHARTVDFYEALRGGGATLYVGAPSSRQRLRVYDKRAESDGEIDSVRWEIQAREEAAESLMAQLLDAGSPENWGLVWAGRLLAVADFREEGNESEQRVRTTWFSRLVGLAEKLSAYGPKAPRTLAQVVDWLFRQCAPSLATVVTAMGGDLEFLYELVRNGEARMGVRHRLLLNQRT